MVTVHKKCISDLTGVCTLSSFYYDDYDRFIQSHSTNRLGGTEDEYNLYSFTDKILKKLHVHTDGISANNTIQEVYAYTYDNADRLLTTTHQLNNGKPVVLESNTYDELCRLKTQNINDGKDQVNYAYNSMGNVTNINRNGTDESATNDWKKMNYLTLTYYGNQLVHATDIVNGPNYPASLNNLPHFHDMAIRGNEYAYDNDGNMTEDLNKGITNIQYNLLDLPYLNEQM